MYSVDLKQQIFDKVGCGVAGMHADSSRISICDLPDQALRLSPYAC